MRKYEVQMIRVVFRIVKDRSFQSGYLLCVPSRLMLSIKCEGAGAKYLTWQILDGHLLSHMSTHRHGVT